MPAPWLRRGLLLLALVTIALPAPAAARDKKPLGYTKIAANWIMAFHAGEDAGPVPRLAVRGKRGGGSPNQRALWLACRYAAREPGAQEAVLEYYARQEREGHMLQEQLTPSHWWEWGLANVSLRTTARARGDQPVLAASGRWWRAEVALNKLFMVPPGFPHAGRVIAPGARAWPRDRSKRPEEVYGRSMERDVVMQMILGLPLDKQPWKLRGRDWHVVRMTADLLAAGDDLDGAATAGDADLPRLRAPVYLQRAKNGHVAWWQPAAGTLQPQYWASVEYGETRARYGFAPGEPHEARRVLPGRVRVVAGELP
jgi:hypothetical protein